MKHLLMAAIIGLTVLASPIAQAKPGDEEFLFDDEHLPTAPLMKTLNRAAGMWARMDPRPTAVKYFHDVMSTQSAVQSWVVMRNPDDRNTLDVLVQFRGSKKFVTLNVRLAE